MPKRLFAALVGALSLLSSLFQRSEVCTLAEGDTLRTFFNSKTENLLVCSLCLAWRSCADVASGASTLFVQGLMAARHGGTLSIPLSWRQLKADGGVLCKGGAR